MSWIDDNLDWEILEDYMNPNKETPIVMKTDFMMSLYDRLMGFWRFEDQEMGKGVYINIEDIKKVLLEFDEKLDSKPKPKKTRTMTAVEWLVEQIIKEKGLVDLDIQAAKEMEKEHISEAYFKGWCCPHGEGFPETGEQYYNQTFSNSPEIPASSNQQ
jgi:hypothetical protein